MTKKQYLYSNLFAWGLVLLLITNYVYGWTIPSQNPPGGNITPSFSKWSSSGSDIYYNDGNVGIGTTGPGYELDVTGDIRASTGNVYLGTTGFTAQKEYTTSGDVAAAGWYRVSTITSSAGRGQQQVTIYTTGGSYTPRSTTFRWHHDWGSGAGVSVISEIGSGYWTDVRVTDEDGNSFLEINFTRSIIGLRIGLQYIGGHDEGTLYSGTLPVGGGTVRVTTKADGLFILNDKFIVESGGNVGIGTNSPGAKLHVNGSAIADAFYYSSDKSLKRDIRVLDNNLEKVLELEGVSFNWKENGEASIGLIAQDVEKIFPEAVNENPETGMKSINYGVLVSPLIEAVKEQQGQIELLENRLEKLEGNIKALKVFLNNSEI